ncbi:MAG: long-chain-fatty-acid--CoA ligase [Deltaproteobacteria bacterium]|nr:long-chain-fatty-acid--CoA ligase [Deltaproteobacteria bacterium]
MNLANILELQAVKRPEKTAVLFGVKGYTYAHLNEEANRMANALISLGVQKGDRVAMWLPNCPEFITTFFGIIKTGAVVVPLNILFKAREIEYLLSNSGSKVLVTTTSCLDILQEIKDHLPDLETVVALGMDKDEDHILSFQNIILKASPEFFSVDVGPDHTATILYTSGTTGFPKGAMLTHRNLFMNSEFYAEGLGANENWVGLCVLPLSHLLSLAAGQFVLLGRGGTLHIMERFIAEEAAKLIAKNKITYTFAVPTVYAMLLALPDEPQYDLHSLEICITTGMLTPLDLRKKFEEKFDCKTIQAYGQVESSPVITMDRIDRPRKFKSVGFPLPYVEVKTVDEEDRPLPPNSHGEICARGHCVMKGYWRNPAGTKAALKDGWLHTGDIGMVDEEGYLYIFDRKKDMIICGGYNIYPIEIENLLYEHPKILEASVVGIPDERMGEIPKAYVALKPDQTATEQEIMDFVKERLAAYKKLRAVEFLSALPKGPTGKILRRALREKK